MILDLWGKNQVQRNKEKKKKRQALLVSLPVIEHCSSEFAKQIKTK